MSRKQILGLPRSFFFYLLAMLLLIPISVTIFLLGYHSVASLFSLVGTLSVMTITLAYVVVIDSRYRWPNITIFERFVRVITFHRD